MRNPHPNCGLPANGEGHHPGDPDCRCLELDQADRETMDRFCQAGSVWLIEIDVDGSARIHWQAVEGLAIAGDWKPDLRAAIAELDRRACEEIGG